MLTCRQEITHSLTHSPHEIVDNHGTRQKSITLSLRVLQATANPCAQTTETVDMQLTTKLLKNVKVA